MWYLNLTVGLNKNKIYVSHTQYDTHSFGKRKRRNLKKKKKNSPHRSMHVILSFGQSEADLDQPFGHQMFLWEESS